MNYQTVAALNYNNHYNNIATLAILCELITVSVRGPCRQ